MVQQTQSQTHIVASTARHSALNALPQPNTSHHGPAALLGGTVSVIILIAVVARGLAVTFPKNGGENAVRIAAGDAWPAAIVVVRANMTISDGMYGSCVG